MIGSRSFPGPVWGDRYGAQDPTAIERGGRRQGFRPAARQRDLLAGDRDLPAGQPDRPQHPGFTEYADFAPFLFYGLALFNFVRALRSLKGAAAGKLQAALQQKIAAAQQPPGRPAAKSTSNRTQAPKPAASKSGLPITRTPTVQRMR